MERHLEYLREVQKFTTSQYWNSGVRITSGIMVPMFIMIYQDWLSTGIPFLFGALFVSLTDTPGPIHHRRNGMLASIALNTFIVLVTGLVYDNQYLLFAEVLVFAFSFSLLGIYGARAGAVGTLALVIMLIHMSPRQEDHAILNAVLTAAGGLWYMFFSMILYRLQPYRIAEQAMGETLLHIAEYVRARAAFYKEGADIEETFTRVMKEQVEVLKIQEQMREILFKTRQFVADASPRSRSIMMMFLESLDLYEETMYSYQDYSLLQKNLPPSLLHKFYSVILKLVAEFEHVGLAVQAGIAIKKIPTLEEELKVLEALVNSTKAKTHEEEQSLLALRKTLSNIRGILSRLSKIVLYTRMEAHDPTRFPDQDIEKPEVKKLFTFSVLNENLTTRSSTFRYAIRITIGLLIGFIVASLFSLGHAYWVMLTILTILKPVYNLTRRRNIERVTGTLIGVLLGGGILFLLANKTVLLALMIFSMLMAYSLLRVSYLGFVTFLTTYVLITFHFLNPVQFKSLIGERLLDTVIGSIIAALAARFIFPVWQQYTIQSYMKKSLMANVIYFLAAWNALRNPKHRTQYNRARNEALVNLTNLSENFQQMLAEPSQLNYHAQVHQFVIASHTLTSRISALTPKDIEDNDLMERIVGNISDALQQAERNLNSSSSEVEQIPSTNNQYNDALPILHPMSILLSLATDIRSITSVICKLEKTSEMKQAELL